MNMIAHSDLNCMDEGESCSVTEGLKCLASVYAMLTLSEMPLMNKSHSNFNTMAYSYTLYSIRCAEEEELAVVILVIGTLSIICCQSSRPCSEVANFLKGFVIFSVQVCLDVCVYIYKQLIHLTQSGMHNIILCAFISMGCSVFYIEHAYIMI